MSSNILDKLDAVRAKFASMQPKNNEPTDPPDHQKENTAIKPSSFNLRPLYSRVDINCDKWLLTMDEESRAKLENPPSLADGIDRETEKELRYLGCELIQSGAILLRLPQTAAATGQILFQRFYYQRSFVKYMLEHTVMACLMLASKIEEAPRKTRDVYNVFHRLEQLQRLRSTGREINELTTSRLKPRPVDVNYVNAKMNIIKAERRLLATLGFVVHVKHPHKLICSYIFMLRQTHRTDLLQRAWSYMNDGLRTDMFLRYTPETISCACIYLAARTVEDPVPLPKEPFHWFELFGASDRDVQTIALMLQSLYTRTKPPNMSKLIGILDKIRQDQEMAEKAKLAKQTADKLVAENANGKDKSSKDKPRDENRDTRRKRSRSRSKSPRRDRDNVKRYSPRRRNDDRRKDRRRDGKDKRRSRSRDRFYSDKIKEKSRNREREVYQSLGKRTRKSPSPVKSRK